MARTSIWESGWELATGLMEITAHSGSFHTSASYVKTGLRSSTMSNSANTYQEHTSNLSQCQAAGYFRHGNNAGQVALMTLRQGTSNIVRVEWEQSTSTWRFYVGVTEVASVVNATFATLATFFHVGIDVKIAAVGWIYLYIDGNEILGFDGDTDNAGTTFNRLVLGSEDAAAWSDGAMDDNVWYDTTGEAAPAAVPDYRLYPLLPTGNGNYNEWDGSDGNATDNYLLVDETPHDSDTTYITTLTADDTESFTMDTFTIPAGFAVEEVIALAVARKIDALGTLGLKLGTRLSSTDVIGSTQSLGTSYALRRERQTTKPGGGNWAQADIDALEVIVEAAA